VMKGVPSLKRTYTVQFHTCKPHPQPNVSSI
jgi:hypothetical protein